MGGAETLRVAIAGLGFGEKVHLPALQAACGAEPVALWHPRAERLEAASRSAGLPGYTDFEQLLADPTIDALVIATPPRPRFDLARRALEAGKHLLLEKPVAMDAEQVEELQRLALRENRCVAVDFEYRAVPSFQQLAALLDTGVLGDPWLVRLDWLVGGRADPMRPWNWYAQVREGGGVLGALGTHAFDMLHWLVGPSRRLQAKLSTVIPERPVLDSPESAGEGRGMGAVDSDDIALVMMDLLDRNDRTVPAQISLSAVTRQGRGCWIELHGSEGTLVLGSSNLSDYVHGFSLFLARSGEALAEVPPDPALAFERIWSDGRIAPVARLIGWWAAAIRENRPMVPGLAEAVASQRCCDLARRSKVAS